MTLDERLQAVFRDVFDDPDLVLQPDMTADDIEAWDSLSHVTLLFTVEDEFGVQFSGDEASSLADVGELRDLLRAKGAAESAA